MSQGETPVAISLQGVSYNYKAYNDDGTVGSVVGVKDVTLSIEEGDFVALVGHNGCGKSTLAKLLNGLLLPASGSVTVYGMDTSQKENIFEIRKNVGMVFQNPDNQMVASIVEEDVAFGPENLAYLNRKLWKGCKAPCSRWICCNTPKIRPTSFPAVKNSA